MAPLRLLRLANPAVRAVLGSPAHRLLSGGLLVLTYRGHRSGRTFRIPLRYATMPGGRVVALAVGADGKLWWRSFSQPSPATLLVRGTERAVNGRLLQGDERRAALRAYLVRFPRSAGPLGVRDGEGDGQLDAAVAAVVAFDR
jgi:hypothetical protein